jgi:cell wall-associated NlpC family hydrolase
LLAAALAAVLILPAFGSANPAAVRAKKAEVRALKVQLAAIDERVGAAAERYNGARWKLGEIRKSLIKNEARLERAIADLQTSQRILGERVDALYRRPDPSLVEVVLGSGSLTDAVGAAEAIERAGDQDARIVGRTRLLRNRTIEARRQLTRDREAAKVEVRRAAANRARVEAILAERQRLLTNAKAELRQAITEEAARQREAALAAARGRQVAAASGYTPYDGPLPSGEGNAAAVRIMMKFQGVPYVWGGESPSGFDCSGLATYAYRQIGKDVPHYTYAIWEKFPQVPFDQLQTGDMVFFSSLGHMGIYIGNGMMIHAPRTGDVVRVASMADRMGGYVGAVRP